MVEISCVSHERFDRKPMLAWCENLVEDKMFHRGAEDNIF